MHQDKIKHENWLQYTQHLLKDEEGANLEEKIINRTVNKVKHYKDKSEDEKKQIGKRILKGVKFYNLLTQTRVYFFIILDSKLK